MRLSKLLLTLLYLGERLSVRMQDNLFYLGEVEIEVFLECLLLLIELSI